MHFTALVPQSLNNVIIMQHYNLSCILCECSFLHNVIEMDKKILIAIAYTIIISETLLSMVRTHLGSVISVRSMLHLQCNHKHK